MKAADDGVASTIAGLTTATQQEIAMADENNTTNYSTLTVPERLKAIKETLERTDQLYTFLAGEIGTLSLIWNNLDDNDPTRDVVHALQNNMVRTADTIMNIIDRAIRLVNTHPELDVAGEVEDDEELKPGLVPAVNNLQEIIDEQEIRISDIRQRLRKLEERGRHDPADTHL